MKTVVPKDSTTVAYAQSGAGPALILVQGGFEQQSLDTETSQLAVFPLLTRHLSVFTLNRRNLWGQRRYAAARGEREVEALDALIDVAGESTFVFGISSGGGLALHRHVPDEQLHFLDLFIAARETVIALWVAATAEVNPGSDMALEAELAPNAQAVAQLLPDTA